MTLEGRQWLFRIEWRLASDYGHACSNGDFVWASTLEAAWEIVRGLRERSVASRERSYPVKGMLP
jgi:hypothetical protein